jgi:response regulator RpfG family c-di-GMP phosphodiesterase
MTRAMEEKVLCVDDDQNVLLAFQRHLRKEFQVSTAQDGPSALRMLAAAGPFAVVVSDLRMPGMDGVEFLARVREISPDTVRIMLTGNADTSSAIAAVNEGNIFRFLTKPCQPQVLLQALHAGVAQYRLITAERELLEKTLSGAIRILTEILSITDGQSFGRACSMRDAMRRIGRELQCKDTWDLELAAMLAQLGRVTVPSAILSRQAAGEELSPVEKDMLARVPEIGHNLLANIPRLEPVARAILYQEKHFDGSGFPPDGVSGEQIPLGARILKVLADADRLESEGHGRAQALEIMKGRAGWYDPSVLAAAARVLAQPAAPEGARAGTVRLVCLNELKVGQVLLSDVQTRQGALLVPAGHTISETLLMRIRNFARIMGIKEPLQVESYDDERAHA